MSQANTEKLLDRTSWHILTLLQGNARMTYAEIGKKVGLTAPGVADRVRRLEEAGIIDGYAARINLKAVGIGVLAWLRIKLTSINRPDIEERIGAIPQVLEVYNVTGNDDYVIKVGVRDIEELNSVIENFHGLGETVTSIVINTPMDRRVIDEAVTQREGGE